MKNLTLLLILSFFLNTDAFSTSTNTRNINQLQQISKFPSLLYSTTSTSPKSDAENLTAEEDDEDDDMIQMKRDIEEMRLEAMERIQTLSTKMKDFDSTKLAASASSSSSSSGSSIANKKLTTKPNKAKQEIKLDEAKLSEELIKKRIERETPATTMQQLQHPSHKDDLELLDDTHWKIALNIGREAGTWMPKTWGISGERLLINLEVCFTKQQLHEGEDFLGGSNDNSRVCHVIDQECTVGPTMSEGSRTFTVKDGGYRICKNDGPLGTDLLRFYIDLQEVVQHTGSDVYCPKGRIYCTCGFFPENKGTLANKKFHIRREIQDLEIELQNLQEKIDRETNFIKKMSLMKQMFQLTNFKKSDLDRQLANAQVTEPDTALLRFSRKKDVALTKEGGVCCKVKKDAGRYEYHILGKFGVGAVDAREGHE